MARAVVKRLLHEPTARVRDLDADATVTRGCRCCASCSGSKRRRRPTRTRPPRSAGCTGDARSALRLGTRGSALALAQADEVARLLGGDVELVKITTAGDVDRARGDKSRWVGALESALLAGEIDLAVHSAKDVPGELAPGTVIAATPRRAEPFDVLVGEDALAAVREGARVGTSALRRRAQLLAARPDLEVCELRGNVDTRLAKRAAGEVDVLVLAAAGLDRLRPPRRGGRACCTTGVFVPAAGPGRDRDPGPHGLARGRGGAGAPTTRRPTPRWTPSATSCARSRPPATRRSACSRTRRRRARVRRAAGRLVEWLVEEAADRRRARRPRLLAAGAAELLREAELAADDGVPRRRGPGRPGPAHGAGARADRRRRRDPLRPADPARRPRRRRRRARLRRQAGRRAADAAGGDRPAAGPVRDRRADRRAAQGRRPVRVRARRRGGARAARGGHPVRGRARASPRGSPRPPTRACRSRTASWRPASRS